MSTTKTQTKRHYVKWDTYIQKVLKQVHPSTGISHYGMEMLNRLTNYNIKKIMQASNNLSKASKMKTLTLDNIMTSIRISLPGELSKHAISEARKAVSKYERSSSGTKASRAGLAWAVTRTENRMMESSVYCRKSEKAAVVLAAALEYLMAEIIELAGNATRDYKKVRIVPRHIFLAISNDQELEELYRGVALSGGVEENMAAHFIPKKAKKSSKSKKSKKSRK